MADEILIRVKSYYEEDYDGSRSDVDLRHEVVSIEQLFAEQRDYMFQWRGYVMVDPKHGKIDQKTADLLRSFGWVHADTAKDREERKVIEQEYYLVDEEGKGYFSEPKFSKINIDNLTEEQLKQLARSGKIVQVVSPKSVLSASEYKKLQTKKDQLEKQKAAAKLSAAKKAEKKKAKEIAAAKKLLEEVGEKQ